MHAHMPGLTCHAPHHTHALVCQNPEDYNEERYKQLATQQLPSATASYVPSDGKPGENVDVKLCAMCQGTGMQVEEYNHRRLEVWEGNCVHACLCMNAMCETWHDH